MNDISTLPTYEIHSSIREWVGGITVAQLDLSPATSYKVSIRLHVHEPTHPADAPGDWFDAVEESGEMGVWVGPDGTIPAPDVPGVYLVGTAQLIDDVWSEFRDIGVARIKG